MILKNIIDQYNATLPLEQAVTPPSAWYTNSAIEKLEQDSVFSDSWLVAARKELLQESGQYVATIIAGQPIVIVRGETIKAFYNVCQHHAAQVMETGNGCARALTCPYHGWTYKLDGSLAVTPQFENADDFDKTTHGLKEVRVEVWQQWVFVCLNDDAPALSEFLGELYHQLEPLNLDKMRFHRRVSYDLACNWKVYVDNFLDGGYHVPFLHKGLSSALDGKHYKIEVTDKYCLQSCPTKQRDNDISQVRTGTARYYWQYPNLMINCYDAIMGIIIVEPVAVNKCKIIFEYYFDDNHPLIDEDFKNHSVDVADKIQDEDVAICLSVQQGLSSKGYETGRLVPSKEAGEHLFHKLLYKDMKNHL